MAQQTLKGEMARGAVGRSQKDKILDISLAPISYRDMWKNSEILAYPREGFQGNKHSNSITKPALKKTIKRSNKQKNYIVLCF